MAIDQTAIALDIAQRVTQKVTQFLNIIDEIEEEVRHADQAGINFNNFESEFAGSEELKHLDGALINKIKNDVFSDGVGGLRNWLETTTSGAKPYQKLLYEISR